MYSIIAPSFFRKKTCVLPGIGSLMLVTHPAETDFTNCLIKAPKQEIIFEQDQNANTQFNEFSAMSGLMKEKLEKERRVDIEGIGALTKDFSNTIHFSPVTIDNDFFQTVTAERVLRKDAEHTILVGDKQTTNMAMAEFFNEEEISKTDKWWVWAVVLGAAGILASVFYFSKFGINNFANGLPL
jgi:hypothetical protein